MQIFIGNLAYATTHQGLRQAFEAYGTVEGVSIPLDWATGGSRGFGFVEMPNAMEAAAAIAGLDGTALEGRMLRVSEARPRAEWGGSQPPREERHPRG